MMNSIVVSAASYVDFQSLGNERTGLHPWPSAVDWAAGWDSLRWSDLFKSECPRFGRADPLSKLALIAVELLDLRFPDMPDSRRRNTGVCLDTRFGSLSADLQFLQTGSPNVFTYTLPSTAIGEICIRHKLQGPVRCFVSARAGTGTIIEEAVDLLGSGEAEACLCLHCDALAFSAPPALSPAPGLDYGLAAAVFLENQTPGRKAPDNRELEIFSGAEWMAACRQFCVDFKTNHVQA